MLQQVKMSRTGQAGQRADGDPLRSVATSLRNRPLIRQEGGHAHAVLVFDEPVCGPVVLGAGRCRGYGECRVIAMEGSR